MDALVSTVLTLSSQLDTLTVNCHLPSPGRAEALAAGKALKSEGYQFDVAHTSVLKRAQITLNSVLTEIGQAELPVKKTWRLNERHYGGLTGLNKAETAAKYGEAQVKKMIPTQSISRV